MITCGLNSAEFHILDSEMKLSSINELAEKLKADVYDLCLPEGRLVRT